jgi:hypothetical protein
MTKLIVMLILMSPQGGVTSISGWNSVDACNSAKAAVETFFKSQHGATSYVDVDISCLEFPNKSP